jgi:hypothetical protein
MLHKNLEDRLPGEGTEQRQFFISQKEWQTKENVLSGDTGKTEAVAFKWSP